MSRPKIIWDLNRKLPPDEVLAALIRFGFRYSDIADRFGVSSGNVSVLAKKLGFPRQRTGSKRKINGAPSIAYRAKRGFYSFSRAA